MKNINNDVMEEYIKATLPIVDREHYKLVGFEKIKNEGKLKELYWSRLIVTIEETTKIPEGLDQHLWYAHGYVTVKDEDRPIRDNLVTIVSRRKRRKHKETKKVINSKYFWVVYTEGTKRAEDHLTFLK